jgi:pathogenesis-related protein 1
MNMCARVRAKPAYRSLGRGRKFCDDDRMNNIARMLSIVPLLMGACSDGASSSPDEPPELSGITAAHNRVRADVGVGPMTWSPALATLAAGFIADCQFAHSTGPERSNVAGFDYVGENLYQSGGFVPTGAQVSDSWASEKSSYNYAANSCSGVCGHYTQQVWKTSTALGCAIKACPGGANIVSCEYGPGGNYQGQKPY